MKWPCPCCGHQTLPQGPGDYELCPVCFWEDDPAQLRWPLSADGANGVTLQDAQRTHERIGAMHAVFLDQVRGANPDEPCDPGWRPFDPSRDAADPGLDGPRWPKNLEALYWWRPTYWKGDPDAVPASPVEAGPEERLLERLRHQVPQVQPIIEALEWQYGSAFPIAVFAQAAELAIDAYRGGNRDVGDRIVRVMNDGLVDEEAARNGVVAGFLENEGWHAADLHDVIDTWPSQIQAVIRRQRQSVSRVRTRRWHRGRFAG